MTPLEQVKKAIGSKLVSTTGGKCGTEVTLNFVVDGLPPSDEIFPHMLAWELRNMAEKIEAEHNYQTGFAAGREYPAVADVSC